jgi:hypothetical protein
VDTELDGLIPEMPSQCITCKGWFELNDMWGSLYNFSAVVCDGCHRDELAPADGEV